jgi:pimeloyl-ACP methyl ester carboxylesterase
VYRGEDRGFYVEFSGHKNWFRMLVPKSGLKRAILFCHGFPGRCRLPGAIVPVLKQGTAWIEAYYRGDKERGERFGFLKSIDDIRRTGEKARELFKGMPITALGYSYGGFCVVNIIREEPGFFDDVILLNPLVDAGAFSDKAVMAPLWEDASETLLLDRLSVYEDEIVIIAGMHNPVDFAGELATPIHFVQSRNDEVLSFEAALAFYDKLRCKKRITLIHGAGHNLVGDEPKLLKALMS